MTESTGSHYQEERRRSLQGLLFWLALLPVIVGSLFCCAQTALLVVPKNDWSADTASRLLANYLPWGYQVIPPLRLAELLQDIEQDNLSTGTPKPVITAEYWIPPTPTGFSAAVLTSTPTSAPAPTSTSTAENPTPAPSSTSRNPSTLTPTATSTRYVPPPPSATFTERPNPMDTDTPVPPSATPVPPSATPVPPSPTSPPPPTPVTPSPTPVTPTPETPTAVPTTPPPTQAPTYAPVWPIPEYNGASTPVPGGCRASFGYRNENPQPVTIPIGPLNQISVETAVISPSHPQPTTFLVGRITGAFEVSWSTEGPLIWSLDGRLARAEWCNPPAAVGP